MSGPSAHKVPALLRWSVIVGIAVVFIWLPEFFPGNSRLYDAIEEGDAIKAQALLHAGADPNSRSAGLSRIGSSHERSEAFRYPPLIYAIRRKQPAISLLLLEAGADPNARDPRKDTALIAAADQGMTEVVRSLIDKGADVRAGNPTDGSTPLHAARALDVERAPSLRDYLKPEIIELLREAGAH